jgi:8-oxo-dGTP pyrophosphatase MutT (NUDIX family)
MSPRTPWEVLSSRLLLERRWLKIRALHVRLANGHELDEFHLLESPEWASVVAVTADSRVVMVRQYRHGAGRSSLELPAGVIDGEEQPLCAAQRELEEETGFVAREWHPLMAVNPEPARHRTRAHFFVALGAEPKGTSRLEPAEVLGVELLPQTELMQRFEAGDIVHGVHVGAILLAARRGFIRLDL